MHAMGTIKTTINIDEDLLKKFSIIVIQEKGYRKKNEVITDLIREYIQKSRGGISMSEKMSYEEFRDRIQNVLKSEPAGLTWTEIRKRANLYQKFPNNRWVHKLEEDIGLVREKTKGKTIWKLK